MNYKCINLCEFSSFLHTGDESCSGDKAHVTYSPVKAVIRRGFDVVVATVHPVDPLSVNV